MLTKETPESFYIGKLITCVVTGIAHRRPQGESYDQAIRNDETGLWQCPFCRQVCNRLFLFILHTYGTLNTVILMFLNSRTTMVVRRNMYLYTYRKYNRKKSSTELISNVVRVKTSISSMTATHSVI